MKVIFDVSLLAQARLSEQARTGLFRVVDNVARGLVASGECTISLCLAENLKASIDFLNEDPQLGHVNFALSRPAQLTSNLYRRIDHFTHLLKDNGAGLKSLPVKVARKTLYHLAELTGRYPTTVSDAELAQADIYHSPFHPIPWNVKTVRTLKRMLTVYDLIPILYPEFFDFKATQLVSESISSVGTDDSVICISHQTREDLCNYRPDLDPARIAVTHLAASDLFHANVNQDHRAAVRARYGISEDVSYLLSLGTLERRKNLETVVKCFARLVRDEAVSDLRLLLVGTKGLGFERILETIDSFDIPRDFVILTGYVADEDLAALYNGALAFAYLSFYEGFGLPPLEAMQCGTPVITSNTSSLPEVVGDAGIMVEPTDEDSICQSFLELYRNSKLREEMSRRSLSRAAQFSWDKCVRETIAAYKSALDR